MTRFTRSLCVGVFGLLLASSAFASTIYVKAGALAGTGACSTPYGTIAEAIADAKATAGADEIRITQGIYAEHDLLIDFSDVTLKGGYPTALTGCPLDAAIETNRNPATLITTMDAQQLERHLSILPVQDVNGVFVSSNVNIVLDGITFINGKPADATNGGSVILANSDARISNCTFRANGTRDHFVNGGAIYQVGYATDIDGNGTAEFRASNLTITGSLFENNLTGAGGNGSGSGGAIYAVDFNFVRPIADRQTTLTATNNTFRGNVSNGSGDLQITTYCMADTDGDTIPETQAPNDACPPQLSDGSQGTPNACHAQASGGAVALLNVSGTWDGNTFENNRATAFQTDAVNFSGNGGALYTFSSSDVTTAAASPRIANNTFTNNLADAGRGNPTDCGWFNSWGGAVYAVYFTGDFVGNSVTGNQTAATGNSADNCSWGGGALIIPAGSPLIDGNNFIGNQSFGGGFGSDFGGGAYVNDFGISSPRVTNNVFDGNIVTAGADQVSGYGGGLAVESNGPEPLIAHNTMVNNTAEAPVPAPHLQMGWGGGMWARIKQSGGLIADNVVKGNFGSVLDPANFPVKFSGVVMGPALIRDDPDAAARIQNNLIVQNDGVGLMLMGFPVNGGDLLNGAEVYNNTIAENTQSALMLSLADTLVLHGNIMFGNNTENAGVDWPTVLDDWFAQRASTPMTVQYNMFDSPLLGGTDFDAQVADSANGNLVDVDPEFSTDPAPGGDGWYLRQPADQGPPRSPGVDLDPTPSASANFGTNSNYSGDSMVRRTTKSISKSSDLCFTDLGFHHSLGATPVDTDGDTVPDADEGPLGLNPMDADSDDDGVPDGIDCGPDLDGDGTTAALDCDSDGDGVTDGTERGVTTPVPDPDGPGPLRGTDTTATCDTSNAPCGNAAQLTFVADDQPSTRTDPLNPDTDGGFETDGCEDANHNGRSLGASESDPNNPADDDADRDNLTNSQESFRGTDTLDADTDDDGIRDDLETDPANLFTYSSDAVNCDTDGDGIFDGVERALGPVPDPDGPGFPARGTDCPYDPIFCFLVINPNRCFAVDADPTTRTYTACTVPNCEGHDTDGDGCWDGVEDANFNGRVDGAETDPNVAGDCSAGGILVLDNVITALSGGGAATCGPKTLQPIASLLGTACGTVIFTCDPAMAITAPTLTVPAGTTITNGAAPSSAVVGGRGVLVFYETPNCTQRLVAQKRGNDVYLDLQ
jgi:hypothetical protein